MKNIFKHIEFCILRGFITSIPIYLCYAAVSLLYNLVDKKVVALLNKIFNIQQSIPGLGVAIVLVILYLTGLVIGNFVGKNILRLIETIVERIPLIKSIYGIGKQLSKSLDMSDENKGFKKTVLVNFNNMLVPGFITGTITDEDTKKEKTLVFLPTAPSPTQGFVMAVSQDQIIDPGWSVEEGLKVVVSAGIIAPKSIQHHKN